MTKGVQSGAVEGTHGASEVVEGRERMRQRQLLLMWTILRVRVTRAELRAVEWSTSGCQRRGGGAQPKNEACQRMMAGVRVTKRWARSRGVAAAA